MIPATQGGRANMAPPELHQGMSYSEALEELAVLYDVPESLLNVLRGSGLRERYERALVRISELEELLETYSDVSTVLGVAANEGQVESTAPPKQEKPARNIEWRNIG